MARGIIEGVGGAGFPTGWKQKESGEVYGSNIEKSDPIVLGVYGDWETQIDKIPDLLPGAATSDVSFYSDYMAIAKTVAPYLKIYKKTGSISFTEITTITGLPITGSGTCVSFSPDGNFIAVGSNAVGDYLCIFNRVGDVFTKISNPATIPTTAVRGLSFSPDGIYLAVSDFTDTLRIYKKNGSLFEDFTTLLPSSGKRLNWPRFSPDGKYLSISSEDTPYIFIYSISGEVYTKLSGPVSLPVGGSSGCDFSPDGKYLAVCHVATPYVTIYSILNDVFTKIVNPAILPSSAPASCSFDVSSTYLSLAVSATPVVFNYKIIDGKFEKMANPSSLPPQNGYGNSFSKNGEFLAIGSTGTPHLTIYRTDTINIVSKVTHFSTNPLSWLPNNDNIGISLQAGVIGDTINVNLFPALNNI